MLVHIRGPNTSEGPGHRNASEETLQWRRTHAPGGSRSFPPTCLIRDFSWLWPYTFMLCTWFSQCTNREAGEGGGKAAGRRSGERLIFYAERRHSGCSRGKPAGISVSGLPDRVINCWKGRNSNPLHSSKRVQLESSEQKSQTLRSIRWWKPDRRPQRLYFLQTSYKIFWCNFDPFHIQQASIIRRQKSALEKGRFSLKSSTVCLKKQKT